jgi:hypothetical protein
MSKNSKPTLTSDEEISRSYERMFGEKPSEQEIQFHKKLEHELLYGQVTSNPVGLIKQPKDRTYP